MVLDELIAPADLGLPDKFQSFRPAQVQLIDFAVYESTKPYTLVGAPPGVGKSLSAMAIGLLSGVNFAVLTATRALEDQMVDDFESVGLVNVRGRQNYECQGTVDEVDDQGRIVREVRVGSTCEDGADRGCKLSGGLDCPYSCKYERAKESRSTNHNYQYWMHARSRAGALETEDNPIQLLILDEAHQAYEQLARFLGTWVGDRDIRQFADREIRDCLLAGRGSLWGRVSQSWIDALDSLVIRMESRKEDIRDRFRGIEALARRGSSEYRHICKVQDSLGRVLKHGADNNWIWRQTNHPRPGLSFDCIWPGRYAARYLWSGVQRVVLMSATIRPKHAGLLGLGPSQYVFKEWPRQFPAHLSPVYWIPTGKMGQDESMETKLKAVQCHDRIIEAGWGKYKGLVHTGSYGRAEWLRENSRYGRRMIVPDQLKGGISPREAFNRHMESKEPTTLVGPSYHTGWDMPDDSCRWIHWLKLPFPDRSDPIVVARQESDREWYACETMQSFVQGSYRGSRHDKDWCWTFVSDDSVERFRSYARGYAPQWFRVLDVPKDRDGNGRIPGPPQ